jgi:protein involved in polysaccharide export with SLBB domain
MTSRNAKDLERGIRNHSERGVRNGSELSGLVAANHDDDSSSSRAGRPPVLNDQALDDLVALMHRRAGRLPRVDELIAEAGGCQRLRASKALQRARLDVSERELMGVLRLPAELEQLQRRWIEQWMQAAAGQLADRHADLVAKHEERIEALEALISEQHRALTSLRGQRADLERMTDELLKARDDDRLQIERLAAERDIAERLARGRN